MANRRLFTEEEIRRELERLDNCDDEYFSQESDSEEESDILSNDDVVQDDFDVAAENEAMPMDEDSLEEVPDFESNDGENSRNFVLGKDGETIWTDTDLLPSRSIRIDSRNIITHLPGPRAEARDLVDEEPLFSLFINQAMIDMIVQFTNEQIEVAKAKFNKEQRYIGPTDALEIKAFLGLLFYSGVMRNSNLNLSDMFSRVFGPPIFRTVMCKNRFIFLLCCLRFDSKATREARKRTDKFSPFREFWDMFNQNCIKYYAPSEYMTVDETLLSFKGRCGFRMYIPAKPDKYGLKLVSICDARTFFFCGGIPYIGKDTVNRQGLLLPTQYVLQLTNPIKGTNRNITCDNWFSSVELSEELSKRKLTMVGTLRKNKREIPPSLIATTGVPLGTSRFLYQPDKTLVSYNQKKNKNVILLSSMHDTGTVNQDSGKPDIVEFYNLTKGGVDVFDKLCHTYSTKRGSRRWPMRYFFGVLDAAGINAFILHRHNNNAATLSSRANFLKSLAFSLAEPHIKKRMDNPRLPKSLRAEIRSILGVPEPVVAAPTPCQGQPSTRKRCHFCTNDRKTFHSCEICYKPICKLHEKLQRMCQDCLPETED